MMKHSQNSQARKSLVLVWFFIINCPKSLASADSPRSNYPNVAYMKTTYQGPRTLTWEGSTLGSERAVDGYLGTKNIDVSHTEDDRVNYWVVDLGKQFQIRSVAILNRLHDSFKLQNFTVDVFREDPRESLFNFPEGFGDVCAHQDGEVAGASWEVLDCEFSLVGRFVRIVKYGFSDLAICEVEVFALESSIHTRFYKRATDGSVTNNGSEVLGKFRSAIECASFIKSRPELGGFDYDNETGSCLGVWSNVSHWKDVYSQV